MPTVAQYKTFCLNSTTTCTEYSPDAAVIPEQFKCNNPIPFILACIATAAQLVFTGLQAYWSKDATRVVKLLQMDGTVEVVEEHILFHIGEY